MKNKINDLLLWFGILAIIAALCILGSCNTTKHIQTAQTRVDSVAELRDSVRMLTTENEKLIKENFELQYSALFYDTVRVNDTINHYNTVYIDKDGGIKATGNISKVVVAKSGYEKIISEKNKEIDSLRLIKNKVETKTETKFTDRVVNRSYLNWWVIAFAFIGGILFWVKFGSYFKK